MGFFLFVLSHAVTLRVALIRGQLSPIMTVRQRVNRRQRHTASQRMFIIMLDLTNHQNAAPAGLLQKRLE